MPNKLSRFWQELKRRKVISVIAMYAGAAYVLIELTNNVVEPLNLPDWTPRLVIIIAVVGFPVVSLLSWIFDLSSRGIVKTEPLESSIGTSEEREPQATSAKRKLKGSDVVIGILLILVGILAFPRIFKGSVNVRIMTIPVTIVNELGEKETKRVFKKDYLSRIALFPFANELHDTAINWVQDIIYDAILKDYQQYDNIIIEGDYGVSSLNEQIRFAESKNFSHFLTGTYRIKEGAYELKSRLYQTASGSLLQEQIFIGMDLMVLIDSICHRSRRDLGILDIILKSTPDLPVAELTTYNLEAYRYYTGGRLNVERIPTSAKYISLNKAVQLDSTFAYAMYLRASLNHNYQINHTGAVKDINQAMRHRQRLSEYADIATRQLYYQIHGETEKAVALSEMLTELRPFDYRFLESLTKLYLRQHMYVKAEKALLELNEIVPDHLEYKILLIRNHLYNGKYSKGLKIINELLIDHPQDADVLLTMGQFYLHMKDLDAAEDAFNRAILLIPEETDKLSLMLDHIEYERENQPRKAFLESYTGKFRADTDEQIIFFNTHNNQLYFWAENQIGHFGYPIADTVFVSVVKYPDANDIFSVKQSFERDRLGKFSRLLISQSNHYNKTLNWKESPLIIRAKELLRDGKFVEALDTFLIARDQNPEHYYLNHFIQHLEFIQSDEYHDLSSIFESYAGEYGNLSFNIKGQKYFCSDKQGFIYELLPLTENTFMVPSNYNAQIQILSKDGWITGLKVVYRDGGDDCYPRNVGLGTNRTQN